MSLIEKFREYIKKEDLFNASDKLLLAVSGGVDSVVLAALCHQCGYHFAISHCNFGLRGEESDRDEQFVRALAEKYAVRIFTRQFDTKQFAEEHKVSIQVAARELRYSWFHEIAGGKRDESKVAFNYVVTAHHADDNIETLLMNFFKGTGISGLRGILPKQHLLIRPLLPFSKDDLKEFARQQHLDYVEDVSNSSDKYTRNYFRNQLIPDLEKVFPKVKDNLSDNLQRFPQIELLYQQAIAQHKKKLLEAKGNEIHLSVLKLKNTTPLESVIYEIIKEFGFSSHQVTDVTRLLSSESGKYVAATSFRIIRNRSWLIIAPIAAVESNLLVIEEGMKLQEFPAGRLEFKQTDAIFNLVSNDNNQAFLDASQVRFPLLLRKWKQGDYFYPLGMKKKKKLSRFFIDQKLSATDKEKRWVLEMNKKIIWVIGKRIDERFKILPSTTQVMHIHFVPKD